MCKDAGFIKLYRKLRKNELLRTAEERGIFVDLLLEAEWDDAVVNGRQLKRGQLIINVRSFAREEGVTHPKMRYFLDKIAGKSTAHPTAHPMIICSTLGNKVGVLITICNYDKYQVRPTVVQHTEQHNDVLAAAQSTAMYIDKKEEKKEEKKKERKKKEQVPPSSAEAPLVLEPVDPGQKPTQADIAREAFRLWNEKAGMVKSMSRALELNHDRVEKLQRRLKTYNGLEGWKHMLDEFERDDWYAGRKADRNGATFRNATLDWVLSPAKYNALVEANINRQGSAPVDGKTELERRSAELAALGLDPRQNPKHPDYFAYMDELSRQEDERRAQRRHGSKRRVDVVDPTR